MSGFTLASYVRISAEDQDKKGTGKEESNSIANQRNLLADFIRRMPEFSGAVHLEFCDDGWSGKNFERPAVREMLEKVKQGEIQCIIVKDISRFGRDYLTVGNYLSRVFPFLGVRFIAVNDGFDSNRQTDIDSLETSFKTLLYDLYSRDLSRKVRHAKQFRAQKGDFMSPFAPYGYRKSPDNQKQLVIDPEAAGVVRRIFQMTAEGITSFQIARTLNKEQVLTPMMYKRAAGCSRTWPSVNEDNFWTNHIVVKILRDERYLGKTTYGKRTRNEVGDFHTIKKSREEWVVVENTHEGIVTQEEFDHAQAQMREFKEAGKNSSGRSGGFLDRKVRCGICGHIMHRRNKKQPYYTCQTPYYTDIYLCTRDKLWENDLLEVVRTELHMQALYAVELRSVWEAQHQHWKCDTDIVIKEISRLKESCAGWDRDIQELYEKFVFGEVDKAVYLKTKNDITQKKSDTMVQLEGLEAKLRNIHAGGKLKNHFIEHFQPYAEVEELTAEMVLDVLERIDVYPDMRLEIVWNYQEDMKQLLFDIRQSL